MEPDFQSWRRPTFLSLMVNFLSSLITLFRCNGIDLNNSMRSCKLHLLMTCGGENGATYNGSVEVESIDHYNGNFYPQSFPSIPPKLRRDRSPLEGGWFFPQGKYILVKCFVFLITSRLRRRAHLSRFWSQPISFSRRSH